MIEKEWIKGRIEEKSKLQRAQRQMVKLLIATSSLIFFTLILVWMIQSVPQTEIPKIYLVSSLIIILSSLSVILTNRHIKSDEIPQAVTLTTLTIILGMLFIVTQYAGWNHLIDQNQQFKNILLPFTVIHFAHTLIGLVFLCLVFFRLRSYSIHSKNSGISSNVFYFWHFLGVVWLSFIGIMS